MMAGPIFQGMVGCIAFLLWCAAEPDTMTKQFLYLLSTASFFSLSFNLNPLVKLDGYFALEFATDIFSLRTRAWSYFFSKLTLRKPKEEPNEKEKLIFMLYAPLSIIYTALLMYAILSFYFVTGLLNLPYLGTAILTFVILASNIYVEDKSRLAR
jgi:putative peptide zinc metalloprotease protein